MADVQLNGQSLVTTSATTAPAAGTSETWTVTALAAGIPTLATGQTYALVDATLGATAAQQAELVRVTAATAGATSITVTRGADSTTPVAHAATSAFNLVVVASWFSQSLARFTTPQQFGAKGDGVADDTTAIQNAVTNAASGGVYFPPGTYLISAHIVLPSGGNCTIRGAGFASTIIRAKTGSTMTAMITSTTGASQKFIQISDLQLDGNNVASAATSGDAIYMDTPWYCTFSGLYIHDCSGKGINLDNLSPGTRLGAPNKILHSYIYRCADHGVSISVGVTDTEIVAVDNGGHTGSAKAFVFAGTHVAMTSCMGWGSHTGLYQTGGEVYASGCRFDQNRYYGVWSAGNDTILSGCLIYDNSATSSGTWPGVNVDSGSSNFVMTGCRSVGGLNSGTQQQYGVYLTAGRAGPALICDNDLSGNSLGAIGRGGLVAGDRIINNTGDKPPIVKVPLATATTTVETVVLQAVIPANTFAVGDIIRYKMWLNVAVSSAITVRVRIGSAGTTADASVIVMSVKTSVGAVFCDGLTAIAVIGASATHIGGGIEFAINSGSAGTAIAATGTFDSTAQNYVSVTIQNGTSTTTTVLAGLLEVV